MNTPRSPMPCFLVALGGTLFALGLPLACSSSDTNPPALANCVPRAGVKCTNVPSSGGGGVNDAATPGSDADDATGIPLDDGGIQDVNAPPFDGNLGFGE